MVRFGRIWSDLVGFGRILISGKFGLSDLVGFGRSGRIWSDLVGFGQSSFWEGTYTGVVLSGHPRVLVGRHAKPQSLLHLSFLTSNNCILPSFPRYVLLVLITVLSSVVVNQVSAKYVLPDLLRGAPNSNGNIKMPEVDDNNGGAVKDGGKTGKGKSKSSRR